MILMAFSLIFTRSPACAAILYAINPSFTSSAVGSPKCSTGVK